MGIQGLLPFLEKASKQCHVSQFRGSTVAVDSYCWLHKGAFGCAEKIIRGEDSDSYVAYCMKYIKLLKHYEINVIMVFDGRHLTAKKGVEKKRREAREKARKQAIDLMSTGNIQDARKYIGAAVNITHQMALKLIKECRKLKVDCIVAPYEADAQLAYLNLKNLADYVITEDSDLLLFGCPKVIFKLDINGSGILVESDKLHICMKLSPDTYNFNKFRYMCILSGCDYLDSLPGIGLKKALRFVTLTASTDMYKTLSKLPSYLRLQNLRVTTEYKEAFMIADATFKHQLVYDPINRKLLPLQDPELVGTKEEYCINAGEVLDDDVAFQLAIGNLDPLTLQIMDNWLPNENELSTRSIWHTSYRKSVPKALNVIKVEKKKLVNVEVKRVIEDEAMFEKEVEEIYASYKNVKRKYVETPESNRESAGKRKLSKFNSTNINSVTQTSISRYFTKAATVAKTELKDECERSEALLECKSLRVIEKCTSIFKTKSQ